MLCTAGPTLTIPAMLSIATGSKKCGFQHGCFPCWRGPCFWQSYHKLQGHCQGFSINRSWCALHASLMVGSFLLHAAISGGETGLCCKAVTHAVTTTLEDCFLCHLSLLETRSSIPQSCSLGQACCKTRHVTHIPSVQHHLLDPTCPCYCCFNTFHQILP